MHLGPRDPRKASHVVRVKNRARYRVRKLTDENMYTLLPLVDAKYYSQIYLPKDACYSTEKFNDKKIIYIYI